MSLKLSYTYYSWHFIVKFPVLYILVICKPMRASTSVMSKAKQNMFLIFTGNTNNKEGHYNIN